MKSAELRSKFLDFFKERGHQVIASSPLVPANDPTLLFTNAGMVQFKDVFLGQDKRPYTRAASSQRCVRAGGKHNDLENVGYTARHHTFFEMLGNFSFGDYFKKEGIEYAWEFLTQVLGLAEERLWVTVYEEDDEATDLWLNHIGVSAKRFSRLGMKDNFWAMGDTGPCGPCSEIFYDHGPDVPGGPPGSKEEHGDRYVEIWNLVFMQFERDADGTMNPLPKPSVDTGMGLERVAAVMQGVHSNYEIDLFADLIKDAATITGTKDLNNKSLNVIADHIRSSAFLIVDGVLPSSEGRGYVLRRIIRRALRHGYILGMEDPFFYKLSATLDRLMGVAYPELSKKLLHVERVLLQEEQRFAVTLSQGMRILEEAIAGLGKDKTIPGTTVFKLYDTYGFPIDLTADIARERGLHVDQGGFDTAMEEQRKLAKNASKFGIVEGPDFELDGETRFCGYERLSDEGRVTAVIKNGQRVEALQSGEVGQIVLDTTPFYAESGGQVGDTGTLTGASGVFGVRDTQKHGKNHLHQGVLKEGVVQIGDKLTAIVDGERRAAIVLNHSATHLLHAALRQVLGEHVTQKGSLVAPDRLRFDFSHYEPVTAEQLDEIETLINEEIRGNADAETTVVPYDEALSLGALALFGEKYDEHVRVLRLGDFSMELCGGTHVHRSGDIGLLKITTETGIAAGIRRVEAVTGRGALDWVNENESLIKVLSALVKSGREDLSDKVRLLVEKTRSLEKELSKLKGSLAGNQSDDLVNQATDISGIKVLAARMDGADIKTMRDTVDRLKDKLKTAVIVLGAVDNDKVRLIAGVTKDTTGTVKAGELIGAVAEQVGGRGGGSPDMAQAGGNDPSKLDAALKSVPKLVEDRLA